MAGLAALAISYVLSQFYRTFLAVLTPALTAELGASKADLSFASGCWFLAFALMQVVIGVALDRFGPRRTAALIFAFCGAGGAFLFAVAWSPAAVIAAMTLIGAGCAPLLVSAFFIIAHRYPPARFAVFASWLVAFGNLGNLIGSTPMAAAVGAFGWRASMAALGALSLAVAVAIFVLVRDPKRQAEEGKSAGFGGFIEILKVKAVWPILPLLACNYIPTAGIRGLWAGPYLHDVFGASALTIGNVTFFMAVAMIVGSFVYGPLDTLFGTRKWVAFGGNLMCGVFLVVLAALASPSVLVVALLFLGIGLTGMSYGMMMAHARAFIPPELTGRGVTLLNFFSIIGVGIIQFAAGPLVEGLVDPADPAYAYRMLFVFYAVVMAVALAIYLFARDARPA